MYIALSVNKSALQIKEKHTMRNTHNYTNQWYINEQTKHFRSKHAKTRTHKIACARTHTIACARTDTDTHTHTRPRLHFGNRGINFQFCENMSRAFVVLLVFVAVLKKLFYYLFPSYCVS